MEYPRKLIIWVKTKALVDMGFLSRRRHGRVHMREAEHRNGAVGQVPTTGARTLKSSREACESRHHTGYGLKPLLRWRLLS